MTFGLLAQTGAAMAADVEQRMNRARPVARDDDAFVAERAGEVIARARDLIGAVCMPGSTTSIGCSESCAVAGVFARTPNDSADNKARDRAIGLP